MRNPLSNVEIDFRKLQTNINHDFDTLFLPTRKESQSLNIPSLYSEGKTNRENQVLCSEQLVKPDLWPKLSPGKLAEPESFISS